MQVSQCVLLMCLERGELGCERVAGLGRGLEAIGRTLAFVLFGVRNPWKV